MKLIVLTICTLILINAFMVYRIVFGSALKLHEKIYWFTLFACEPVVGYFLAKKIMSVRRKQQVARHRKAFFGGI